jgi:integrase
VAENPKQHSPGLKWRPRKDGDVPYWVCPEKDIRAGYPIKSIPLPREWTQGEIDARCRQLWGALEDWRKGQYQKPTQHSIRWLINRYQTDEFSPYRNLRPETQRGYAEFSRIIEDEIGTRLLGYKPDRTPLISGEDVLRWYTAWANEGRTLSRAKHLIAHLRLLSSYAVVIGVPSATEVRALLKVLRFPAPPPRDVAPTRAQVMAIVEKAKELGWYSIAATTLAQYELIERRTHIWQWTWGQITPDWRIVYFQNKKGAVRREFNLTTVQPLLALLQRTPKEMRLEGVPVILNDRTEEPWRRRYYAVVFRDVARAAGVPDSVWSMDMRAGGATEADATSGVTDRMLQDAGGWKTASMRDRYRRDKSRNAENVVDLRQRNVQKP